MKNKWIIYLIATTTFLLCAAMSCDNDYYNYDKEPTDIANFDVVVLNNSGIVPKPADGKPVPHKAVVLQLDFEQKVESGESRAADGRKEYWHSTLNDVVDSIRVIAKTPFVEGMAEYSDITAHFKEKQRGKERLDAYSSSVFPYSGLKVALLAEPRVGQHKWEVSVYFASKRELKKIVNLELE